MSENENTLFEFYKTVGKVYNNMKPIEVYYMYNRDEDILYNKETPFNIIDLEYTERPNYLEEQCWEKDFN